jgi:hypothetical protein
MKPFVVTYPEVFRRIEKRLAQSNCWIAMVRGNHDDPAYFATDAAGHTAVEHKRWRTVPDYAVIHTTEFSLPQGRDYFLITIACRACGGRICNATENAGYSLVTI